MATATAANAVLGNKKDPNAGITGVELAAQLNQKVTYTEEIEDMLYHDILISLYRRNPLHDEQQRLYEDSQKKLKETKEKLKFTQSLVDSAEKTVKELRKARAREALGANRTASQIKEDLIAFGVLSDSSSQEEVKARIQEEQLKMLDVAEKLAEIDFDIEVAELESNKYKKSVMEDEAIIKDETEAVEYWEGLMAYNAKMNLKIQNAYKKLTKTVNFDKNAIGTPDPLLLQGIPGQGKTEVYHSAAKRICKELGLNYVRNVTDSYKPSRDDFVMVIQDCAGETSNLLLGGMPKTEEIEVHNQKRFVMTKAFNKRFLSFEMAAGGVLLFDDVSNATQNIQNMLLPVMQSKTFSGLHIANCLMGATGNLGTIDNTFIHSMSAALKTRVLPLFVLDKLERFKDEMAHRFTDAIGTCGVDNFLKHNPEYFSRVPKTERSPVAVGFACSRTYTALIVKLRNDYMKFGGPGVGEKKLLETLETVVVPKLGVEVGNELKTYLRSYFSGTNELALKFIEAQNQEELKLAQVAFRDFMKEKGGHGGESISAVFEFNSSLVDHTLFKLGTLRESPEDDNRKNALAIAVGRFAQAAVSFNDNDFGNALSILNHRLALYSSDYSKTTPTGKITISTEALQIVSEVFAKTPGVTATKKDIIANMLSGWEQATNNVNVTLASGRKSLV